jgi:hypothetical protein
MLQTLMEAQLARKQDADVAARARRLKVLEKQLLALRARAAKLQRQESTLWRNIHTLVGGRSGRLTTMEHATRRKTDGPRPPAITTGSLREIARARGSTGLFCGCPPIRILPQPNGDLDICVLIDCSNDPATSGFRCEYWCATLEAEPVVAIARRSARRRRRRGMR